jgi:hypothetical protein
MRVWSVQQNDQKEAQGAGMYQLTLEAKKFWALASKRFPLFISHAGRQVHAELSEL